MTGSGAFRPLGVLFSQRAHRKVFGVRGVCAIEMAHERWTDVGQRTQCIKRTRRCKARTGCTQRAPRTTPTRR